MEHTKISTDIEQNIKQFQQLFADSADIKMKEMRSEEHTSELQSP